MLERIRKIQVFKERLVICGAEPTIKTISHEKISTTTVRTAVATVESVLRIPHFARIAVIPEKNAEPTAYKIHILKSPLIFNNNTKTKAVQYGDN